MSEDTLLLLLHCFVIQFLCALENDRQQDCGVGYAVDLVVIADVADTGVQRKLHIKPHLVYLVLISGLEPIPSPAALRRVPRG